MPPPHADNTAFVVVPSPAATASAMVTDELRVRLAVREGAASRAREAALSGEAVALAALDRRADGWRALAPAEIRALAAAAASMRERLLAAGVPDEHDDATLYPSNGGSVAACIALVHSVEALEAATLRLGELAGAKPPAPGRVSFAVSAAAAAAAEAELAARLPGDTSDPQPVEEKVGPSSPRPVPQPSDSPGRAPPPPPVAPPCGLGGLVTSQKEGWRARQLQQQREAAAARLRSRAAAIGSIDSPGWTSSDHAGRLVAATIAAATSAALAATRDALSRALDAFDARDQCEEEVRFDQRDIRAWNCWQSFREALDAHTLAHSQSLWAEAEASYADARLARQASLSMQLLEQEVLARRSIDRPEDFRDVVLKSNPLTQDEISELSELRKQRDRNGWGTLSPASPDVAASLARLSAPAAGTRLHHKIVVVDDEASSQESKLGLVAPADGDVIERRRPPPRRNRAVRAHVPDAAVCDSDSEDYDGGGADTLLAARPCDRDSDSEEYE
jgi:hypothetical protein